MGLLAQKSAAYTTKLQGQCQRVMQYQTPVTAIPPEWLGHLSHMQGAMILDLNAVEGVSGASLEHQVDMLIQSVKGAHDTVGLCMLPASPGCQQQVQLALMLACRDAKLDSRLLTVNLQTSRRGNNTTGSNVPQVVYLVLVGKVFPLETAIERDCQPTMHTRVGNSKCFKSLVVGPVNPTMSDVEQKTIPKKRNNAALWSHVWPIDVWTGILTGLDILPMQGGWVIIELEASPNLALHLLPHLLELDAVADGQSSMWLGCHGKHCPAKKQAMVGQLEKFAADMAESSAADAAGKSSAASKRQLTSRKSDTDDTLGSLPSNDFNNWHILIYWNYWIYIFIEFIIYWNIDIFDILIIYIILNILNYILNISEI